MSKLLKSEIIKSTTHYVILLVLFAIYIYEFKILFTYRFYPEIFKLVRSSENETSTPSKVFLTNVPYAVIWMSILIYNEGDSIINLLGVSFLLWLKIREL